MHALIIGATGATGKDLLTLILQDTTFTRVDIFVRRAPDIAHEKLHIDVIDFDRQAQWESLVKGDVLFSCLGTTLKDAGSKDAQWKIDYDYQYSFAKAAKANQVRSYILVSAGFASPGSVFFYSRMKGQLENAVKALDFEQLSIFKPPVLIRKDTDRAGEHASIRIIRFFNKLGLLRSQQPMPTEVLAKAMIIAVKTHANDYIAYEGRHIWDLANMQP